jgi:hypothetical protein
MIHNYSDFNLLKMFQHKDTVVKTKVRLHSHFSSPENQEILAPNSFPIPIFGLSLCKGYFSSVFRSPNSGYAFIKWE